MADVKEFKQKTKEFLDYLTKNLEDASRAASKHYILASDDENLKKRVDSLNLDVNALEKKKKDLEEELKIYSEKTKAKVEEEISGIYAEAKAFHEESRKKLILAEVQEKKILLKSREIDLKAENLAEREKKIQKLEEALKSCA